MTRFLFNKNNHFFSIYIFNNICYIVNQTILLEILQSGNCDYFLELNIKINRSQQLLLTPPVLRWCPLPPYVPLRNYRTRKKFLEELTMQHSLNQVRMIATDMDGTLLNSQDQMPHDFFDILNQVHELGILFVIASGRPYPTLAMQFESCRDKLVFMAENGGCLVNGDTLVHQDVLDTDALSYLLSRCRQVPGVVPILSGFKKAYLFDRTSEDARKEIGRYYKKVEYIHDLADINDPVSKVTVCDFKGAENNSFPALSDVHAPFKATLAGYHWTDLSLADTNKGRGLATLQQTYGISSDETMVFGDYLNDYEMMKQGYFSYAMANAHPDLKKISNFETLSNDEDGVLHIIRQVLLAFRTI